MQWVFLRPIRQRYPPFIAHTNSCANPLPSQCLGLSPCAFGLCRLLPAPAGKRTFPTLSLRIFLRMLGPIPRWFFWCIYSFLPRRHRPSPSWERLGTQQYPYCNFCTEGFSGLQSFANVQASGFARHPGCTYRSDYSLGSRGFYFPAYLGSLPLRAGDMLAV